MKHWILAAAILLNLQNGSARENWGPPSACPKPKVDCCPKPKPCKPKCQPKPCKPVCKPKCPPKPCKPDCCDPCCCTPRCDVILNPAYNQNAAIDVCCGWNAWIDASFTYWQAMEDNLEVGINVAGDPVAIAANGIANGSVIQMDYEYKPGFKVGLGITSDYDHWDFYAEYIWFRSNVSNSKTAPVPGVIVPIAGSPFVHDSGQYSSVSSSWRAYLDTVDGRMGRWYYVGKQLNFHPYFGIRATWIRQTWDSVFHHLGSTDTMSTNQRLNSWGVGPEIGLNTHWNFCHGFRLFGDAEADILFTQYTTHKVSDENSLNLRVLEVTESDNNTLRAHLNLELGIGWGTYLYCNKYYLDLSAGYGFHIFFDQNMFREFQLHGGASSTYGGNLYLHGLTITAMFEF